jgi:glycosyltransferase involved in cell wall biosynthesis
MNDRTQGRVAYCTTARIGGTFRFYKNLRRALRPHGWRLYGVSVGKHAAGLCDPLFADDGCVQVAPEADDTEQAARSFVDWCVAQQIDIVIPMGYLVPLSAVPHLPPPIRVVMRCNNITRHTYDIVTVARERVSRIVVTSRRQWDDLKDKRGVTESLMTLIPHGIELKPFEQAFASRTTDHAVLRLGYVGRLHNAAKGIFLLPTIAHLLDRDGVPYRLNIVGDGPDREALQHRLQRRALRGNVHMLGQQPHESIPSFNAQTDVFLMPSYYEGFGFCLVEAMAAGAVPIVSGIRGVTDWIVEDAVSGFVCPAGKPKAFARRALELHRNRDRLAAMSQAARDTAQQRFDLRQMGRGYAKVFGQVVAEPPPTDTARPWADFAPSKAFAPSWQRFAPTWAKNLVRSVRERVRSAL